MGGKDHSAALLVEVSHRPQHDIGIVRVEIAGRLICKENLWLVEQRSGYRGTLLLTGAKLRGCVINPVSQAEFSYQLIRPFSVERGA